MREGVRNVIMDAALGSDSVEGKGEGGGRGGRKRKRREEGGGNGRVCVCVCVCVCVRGVLKRGTQRREFRCRRQGTQSRNLANHHLLLFPSTCPHPPDAGARW